jgi:hypothetical protein
MSLLSCLAVQLAQCFQSFRSFLWFQLVPSFLSNRWVQLFRSFLLFPWFLLFRLVLSILSIQWVPFQPIEVQSDPYFLSFLSNP